MNSFTQPGAPLKSSLAPRWTYAALLVAFLFVLMPFLFWQSTWFGKPLSDDDIGKYFADTEHPRKAQHALAQIADRILRGDRTVSRWYPQVAGLARHPVVEIRTTAAWVMGQDNTQPEFHRALALMLEDAHPLVRRNAALSLVRFQDASGHAQLLDMLRPFTVVSPHAGALAQCLKVADVVNPGTLLARIRVGDEDKELRAELPGTLERWLASDGATVAAGQGIATLAPAPEMVWESLRALVLVGTPADIPEIERFARASGDLHDTLRQQAQIAIASIRKRNSP